jgi:predicted ATPase
MVGRERERAQLEQAFAGAARGRCQLFTLIGDAGVGKSRLVAEFLGGVDAAVARGRCLPYGDGITYSPVVEVLEQLGTRPVEPAAAAAVAAVLGESDEAPPTDEIAWAVRRTFEQAAAERPLVVVLDDIHWGEQAFLDLVEHVADFARDSALLLLCMARPELHERRPGWAGGKPNTTTTLLEPLSPSEADELIGLLAAGDEPLRARVRDAAAGNPLFIEEMLAFARESGDGGFAVPPTIRALLAARLDRLDAAERAVLRCGAVEGEVFHRGAVQALTPVESDVTPVLMALVRKELVRPEFAQLTGDEAYRFRHLLLRDAAYDALPKTTRAELHERLARLLEEREAELVELDELAGYHLEQAHRYRTELDLDDDGGLAAPARSRLAAAGRRALLREDPAAAVNLLGRAVALLPPGAADLPLELDLIDALADAGDYEGALGHARELARRSATARNEVGELCARIREGMLLMRLDPEGALDRLAALVADAMPVFEAAGDDLALWLSSWAFREIELHRLHWRACRRRSNAASSTRGGLALLVRP